MNIKIAKKDIVEVLSKVQGITGRKSSLAITETVLMRTSGEGISLLATDLETGFEGSYPAKVVGEGLVAIGARKFYEIVKEFPSEEIEIQEIENRWIKIGNGHVEYNIVGMNPEDFPDNPVFEDVAFFEIDAVGFKKMIEKTVMIGGAVDDKRAHLNGVYFEIMPVKGQKSIRLVSTDGSRLASVDHDFDEATDLPAPGGFIIPKKGLTEVGKFLDAEGRVSIGFRDNHFVVKKNRETIIIRLLEGDFPQYAAIITKGDGHALEIEKYPFIRMLKRMSILTSENYKGVIFKFSDGKLDVTATNPDIGESKEDMPVAFEGHPIEAAFNPKYFIELLNVVEGETVRLHITSDEKPCFIEGVDDKNFISVIMPMRI